MARWRRNSNYEIRESDLAAWETDGGIFGGPGSIVVAASDSPTSILNRADYQCDGVADQVEINAALASCLRVDLAPGTFTTTAPVTVSTTGTTLRGSGYGTAISMHSSFVGTPLFSATYSAPWNSAAVVVDSGSSSTMLGNVTIADLKIVGNNIGSVTTQTYYNGINFASYMGRVRNVYVGYTSGDGIMVYGREYPGLFSTFDTALDHCLVQFPWGAGFSSWNAGMDLLYTACKPIDCGNRTDFNPSGFTIPAAVSTTFSGSQALPFSNVTLTFASVSGFPTASPAAPKRGFLGEAGTQQIAFTYTGKSGSTLTGCTSVDDGPYSTLWNAYNVNTSSVSNTITNGTAAFAWDPQQSDGFRFNYSSMQATNCHPYGCTGSGFRFGAKSVQNKILNCKIEGNRHGVIMETGTQGGVIVGCNIRSGVVGGTAFSDAIAIRNNNFGNGQGAGYATIVGNQLSPYGDDGSASMRYAINIESYNAQFNTITGNRIEPSGWGGGVLNYPIPGGATANNQLIGLNHGMLMEGSGSQAVTGGVTSVAIDISGASLAFTPTKADIVLTPQLTSPGAFYYVTGTPSATSFTVTYSAACTAHTMGWQIRRNGVR